MIVGVFLGMIPLINMLTVSGFAILNAKKTLEGKKELLKWDNWGDIVVKSLTALAIGIIYSIPVIILLFVLLGSVIFSTATVINEMGPAGDPSQITSIMAPTIVGSIGLLLLMAVLLIAVSFIAPMAIMNWIKKGDFGAAFAFGEVFRKAFSGPYIAAWLFAFVYSIVLAIIVMMLSAFPIIGTFIGTGIASYFGSVTSYTLYAQAYKEIK